MPAVSSEAVKTHTFALHMEALDKHRGKSQQTVRVEHVTVNAGGQAIVGNVQGGGVWHRNQRIKPMHKLPKLEFATHVRTIVCSIR